MHEAIIVVPCYNEESRLDRDGFRVFAQRPQIGLLFVDDGSTDQTALVLEQLCDLMEGQGSVYRLERNRGKAEAVRLGMTTALARVSRCRFGDTAERTVSPVEHGRDARL
jgi:glycosyltransferase involved in cell wall biosynthesis